MLRIINSNFTGNEVLGEVTGNKNAKESSKTTYNAKGGAVSSIHDIEIGNCIFMKNHAVDFGGAVNTEEGIRWIIGPSTFISNTVGHSNIHISNKGGAVCTGKILNTAKELVFIDNHTWYGGAIYIHNKNEVTFDSCVFRNNSVWSNDEKTACGGAVYIDSSSSKVHLLNNIIVNNYATDDRGFYNCGKYGTVEHNWFGSNSPNFNDAYLVEWHRIGSNDKISDSNYLQLRLTTDTSTVYESNATLTAYFVDCKGNNFTGKFTNLNVSFLSDGTLDEFSTVNNGDNKATAVFTAKEPTPTHKVSAEIDYQTISLTINQKGNFTWLQEQIDAANGVYNLTCDLSYSIGIDDKYNGIYIAKEIIINGNGHTLDARKQTRIFDVHRSNVVFNNITFINGMEPIDGGGAIFIDSVENVTILNSIFINNSAENYGGTIYSRNGNHIEIKNSHFTNNFEGEYGGGAVLISSDNSIIEKTVFTNNSACQGGALDIRADNVTVEGCEFKNNTAWDSTFGGGAINNFGKNITISNSLFLNNKAKAQYFEYETEGNTLVLSMFGYHNYINAIHSDFDIKFSNVTYWNGAVTTDDNPPKTANESGINFTIEIFDSEGKAVKNVTITSNSTGQAEFDCSILAPGTYTFKASHTEDSYYTTIYDEGEFNVTKSAVYPSSVKINITDKQEYILITVQFLLKLLTKLKLEF